MARRNAVATITIAAAVAAASIALAAQTRGPRTHRLEATPATVAYGYYWADARPVLRIESGDIVDVDTLLTNTPMGLERAGVEPSRIQDSLRRIVADAPGPAYFAAFWSASEQQ